MNVKENHVRKQQRKHCPSQVYTPPPMLTNQQDFLLSFSHSKRKCVIPYTRQSGTQPVGARQDFKTKERGNLLKMLTSLSVYMLRHLKGQVRGSLPCTVRFSEALFLLHLGATVACQRCEQKIYFSYLCV